MLQQALQLGRSCFQRLVLTSLAAALSLGCAADLRERTVSDVRLLETSPSEVELDEALAGLATAAPRTFFWVDLERRKAFDANLVAKDVERIERFYRARGYYDAKVVATRVESVGDRQVEIEVHVTPGPRVTVRKAEVEQNGLLSLPPDVTKKYSELPRINAGIPFDETLLDQRKRALEEMLRESGFAYAKVKVRATVDLNARAADIMTELMPGKRARFGEVRIVGLKQIPEAKVRAAALNLRQGDQYTVSDQDYARGALADMKLFTRIDVSPDLSNPEVDEVPILVTLQEDQLRKLTLGGGTIIDALKFEMHLRTGWEHKNFLGGARKLNVDVTGGVDLFPWRLENLATFNHAPKPFLVLDSTVNLEQPALFNGRTKGSVQASYSMRPVLYSLTTPDQPENEVVIGYHSPSAKVELERKFLGKRIVLMPSYNLKARIPFNYQNLPEGLQTLWISYPRLEAVFQSLTGDIFEDPAKRELELSFRNSVELAGLKVGDNRLLGGSVSDLKVEPEVRFKLPIWAKRRDPEQRAGNITIAGRVKFGFLLAPDYGRTLRTDQADAINAGSDEVDADQQKLLSRAFYSGGSTSNRGYAEKAISPHGPVGFLVPNSINCVVLAQDPRCIRPLGGFTQWEASLEVRYAGLFPITVVVFADTADVSRDIGALQFKYPHLSVGPGVRYESPVGAIRLDFGIRVPGAQALGQKALPSNPASHGQERPEFFFGLPAALQLAIGDAY